uniref:Peptidase S1 domain-containing protein n=1 Tax=Glossina pallidipes TaxID=7398 RepID=A0A1A9ZA59_GLOPL
MYNIAVVPNFRWLSSYRRILRLLNTLIYGPLSTFNAQSLRDNLAIIMLEHDLPATNEAVKMISWQNYDGNLSKDRSMENLKVTAFLSNKGGSPMSKLTFLNASTTRRSNCLKHFYVDLFNTNLQDYGAPLVFNNQLIDIMSYSLDSYSTFIIVGITKYADWIRQHLGDGHHRNSSMM